MEIAKYKDLIKSIEHKILSDPKEAFNQIQKIYPLLENNLKQILTLDILKAKCQWALGE